VYVAPKSFVGRIGCERAITKVVDDDFGSAWGCGGWSLLNGQGCTSVASDSIDHTLIPV
jgi:hypothetical protein